MAEHGYLVIADITGYTAFLSESELEHAEDSLKDLLDLLIDQTKPPLVISRLEGDAIISYAPEASFLQGQTLVEILENTYVAFRQARQRMQLNTSCTCNACRNIPNLDLKFFVHHGTYVLQEMAGHTELVGSDVNMAFRLMKNSIAQDLGIDAYVAYTDPAVVALGIGEFCTTMHTHQEEYEHLGEVSLYIQDLEPVWLRESNRRRVSVDPDEAMFTVETEIPAEPPLVWDYFTKPEYRRILFGVDRMKINDNSTGRVDERAVYICAHGDYDVPQPVLDWRPFDYYTIETPIPGGALAMVTTGFTPTENGTRVIMVCGGLQGSVIARSKAKLMLGRFRADSQRSVEALRNIIIEELESGVAVRPSSSSVPANQVKEAARASIAEAG
ncbi:MAG: DUF2652 domain-containing protein [Anaerolineales bacterium]